MNIVFQPNDGKITPVYITRLSTNEEKFEGLMRSTMVGSIKRFSHFIICTSLISDSQKNQVWLNN